MTKNVPNILTIARVVAVPFFIWAYYKKAFLVAFAIFIIASFTDLFDGKIARKYNLVSNFGKFMDPLADKILNYSAFCLFVADGTMLDIYLIIVLFREFAVAGIRMIAAEKGTVIAADIFGKIKTVLQMIAIPVLIFVKAFPVENNWFINLLSILGNIILVLSVVMTIISGINYIVKNISVLKDEN